MLGALGTCHYIDPIPELHNVKRMDPHMKRAEHAVLSAPDALRARIDIERMYTVILQEFQQNCKNDDRHRIDSRTGYHDIHAVNWTARGKRMCQVAQQQIAARIAYSKSDYEYTFIQHIFAHCRANMKKLQRDIADANAAELPEYADILGDRMVFYQKQVVALQMELVQRQGIPANALTGQLQVPSMHAIECVAREVQRERQRVRDAEDAVMDAAWASYFRHRTDTPAADGVVVGFADVLAEIRAALATETAASREVEAGASPEPPATPTNRHAIECAANAAWANHYRHRTTSPAGWVDVLAEMKAGLPTETPASPEPAATPTNRHTLVWPRLQAAMAYMPW